MKSYEEARVPRKILPLSTDEALRFTRSYARAKGCWNWIKAKNAAGYGRFYIKRKSYPAHRVSYFWFYGECPTDKYVCHKCDNPSCIRPEHLFLGTQKDNLKDCVSKGRHQLASRTTCSNGHKYTKENTRVTVRPNGWNMRRCLKCEKKCGNVFRKKNKAKIAADRKSYYERTGK